MRIVCASLFVVLLFSSCRFSGGQRVKGNGVKASQERQLSGFTGIEISGAYDVQVSQGSEHKVVVTGDENLLEYVEIRKKGDVLDVSSRDGYNLRPKAGINIHVTAPRLQVFRISGSGDIIAQNRLSSSNEIEIAISGSGSVVLNELDAPVVKTRLSGSGEIEVKGNTRSFYADVSGSGDIHAHQLKSESADVAIRGSGTAEVYASRELKTNIAGSGEVLYKGDPTLTQRKAGNGSVRRMEQ